MANQSFFSTNLGLALTPEFDQKKYPEIYADLVRVRNAIRILQAGLDNYTGALAPKEENWASTPASSSLIVQNTSKLYLPASETINPGYMVNIWDDAGTAKVRLARADDINKMCRGFASITSIKNAGDYVEVTLFGGDFYITGLVAGTLYYLSDTPGSLSTSAGTITQEIGWAVSTTCLFFNPTLVG